MKASYQRSEDIYATTGLAPCYWIQVNESSPGFVSSCKSLLRLDKPDGCEMKNFTWQIYCE